MDIIANSSSLHAIILNPSDGASFHFGETGLDTVSDILHSDTLFAALANVYSFALGGARRLVDVIEKGKLRFSSGLYVISVAGRRVFFLPKPLIDFPAVIEPKMLKHIRYVSQGVWMDICATFDPEKQFSTLDLASYPSIGGEFVYTRDELPEIPVGNEFHFRSTHLYPKVKVHTTDDKDRLYHEQVIRFSFVNAGDEKIRPGVFFLVEHSLDEREWSDFLAAVRILCDEGVGGQRSSGRGQFESVELAEYPLKQVSRPLAYLGLSLISPADNSEFHEGLLRYGTVLRGGGSLGVSGLHRKRVRLVAEGALLRSDIRGMLVDVSPRSDRTVLRNGISFAVPMGKMS